MRDVLALLAAFLCGSIPFGLLLVRLTRRVDVRSVGSGNIGATNVARAGGAMLGVLVLVLDLLKGVAGVLAATAVAGPDAAPALAGAVVAAPVAGHVFTPWLGFRGGKGVATALGALAVTDARVLAVALAAFVLAAAPTRIVSAGSLAAAVAAAAAGFVRHGTAPVAWGIAAVAALVIVRHRENLKRIIAGTEPRLGASGKRP